MILKIRNVSIGCFLFKNSDCSLISAKKLKSEYTAWNRSDTSTEKYIGNLFFDNVFRC